MDLLKNRERAGQLRRVDGEFMRDWRRQANANVHNTRGELVRLESDFAVNRSLEEVDRDVNGVPVMERPTKTTPRTERETADIMQKVINDQMSEWARTDPEGFRRRVAGLKAVNSELAHLTDEEAEGRVFEMVRPLAEFYTRRAFQRLKRNGPVILG